MPQTETRSPGTAISAAVFLAILFLMALFTLHRVLFTPAVERFDQVFQSAIHTHAGPTLTLLARTLSAIGSPRTVWPVTLALSATLSLRRCHRQAWGLAVTMAAAGTLESGIKLIVRRPRSTFPWGYVHEHSYSFPSGHATLAIALYGAFVWLVFRSPHAFRQRAAAMLAAATLIPAIGLSRVYLGAHYPTDVIAGYLTGAAILAVMIAVDLASVPHAGIDRSAISQPPDEPDHEPDDADGNQQRDQ